MITYTYVIAEWNHLIPMHIPTVIKLVGTSHILCKLYLQQTTSKKKICFLLIKMKKKYIYIHIYIFFFFHFNKKNYIYIYIKLSSSNVSKYPIYKKKNMWKIFQNRTRHDTNTILNSKTCYYRICQFSISLLKSKK